MSPSASVKAGVQAVPENGNPWSSSYAYEYQGLTTANSIRLLKVHYVPSYRNLPLVCSLAEVDLDHCPVYIALSYAWEGQMPTTNAFVISDIDIHRKALKEHTNLGITQNVNDALRRLQDFYFTELQTQDGFLIWVDAVCINQSDLVERSQQVAIMSRIYKQAGGVAVWLGHGDVLAGYLFRKLWHWGQVRLLLGEKKLPDNWIWDRLFRRMISFDNEIVPIIAQRPYWTRIWTLQELANNDAVMVFCGTALPINFDILMGIIGRFQTLANAESMVTHHIFRQNMFSRQFYFLDEFRLRWSQAKLASNPVDKIYAVRSLGIDAFSRVPVDYSMSADQVFQAATRAVLEGNRSLWIWEIGSFLESGGVSPSWVVDFSRADLFAWSYRYDNGHHYRASKSSVCNLEFDDTGRRLTMKGRIADTVAYNLGRKVRSAEDGANPRFSTSAAYWRASQVEPDLTALSAWTRKLHEDLGQSNRRLASLWLNLLYHCSGSMDPAKYSSLLESWLVLLWPTLAIHNEQRTVQESRAALQNSEDLQAMTWTIFDMLDGHSLFITAQSANLGVVRGDPLPGDSIVLLDGLSMPMLLRETRSQSKEWQIIGPAVVGAEPDKQIMMGDLWPDSESELVDFVIV